jgi:hypothetical protein
MTRDASPRIHHPDDYDPLYKSPPTTGSDSSKKEMGCGYYESSDWHRMLAPLVGLPISKA